MASRPPKRRRSASSWIPLVDRLTDHGPVLLAIDDLQSLDPSTALARVYRKLDIRSRAELGQQFGKTAT